MRDQRITLSRWERAPAADCVCSGLSYSESFSAIGGRRLDDGFLYPGFYQVYARKAREDVWEFANRLFWTLALRRGRDHGYWGWCFLRLSCICLPAQRQLRCEQAVELNRIMFPYLFFVALAALAMGILNCFHMFGLPAATPVVLNVAIIAFSVRGRVAVFRGSGESHWR